LAALDRDAATVVAAFGRKPPFFFTNRAASALNILSRPSAFCLFLKVGGT
jgi:hypothetical protein